MMPKPLIFVSHSAKEQHAKEVLDALSGALQENGFEVLLDKDRLQPGYEWRQELHIWLGRCHGAVILFSEHALRSAWVLKEATILTWRRSLDDKFVVLPVLLPPVKRVTLNSSLFRPLAINEIQSVPTDIPETIVSEIVQRLTPLKRQSDLKSPFQRLERIIATDLQQVPDPALENAAVEIGIELGGWDPNTGYSSKVARGLLQVDIEVMTRAIHILAPYIDKGKAFRIIIILTPFWVDPSAVARIPIVAKQSKGPRVLGINGQYPLTGEMYIRRACCDFPCWEMVNINIEAGEDQLGSVIREVRAAFRQVFYPGEEECPDEEIDDFIKEETDPVFVIVPGHLDNDVIKGLQQKFPTVTFLFLTENTPSTSGTIEFLQPELDSNQEKKALHLYHKARRIVQQSHPNF